MGKFDSYLQKAEALSEQDQKDLESVLETFFRNREGENVLTPEEESELERRLAMPNTKYYTLEEVEARLGWKLTR